MKRALVPILAVVVAALLALAVRQVFFVAPIEANQLYWNQKIFYFHVPCAFMLFAAVFGLPYLGTPLQQLFEYGLQSMLGPFSTSAR